MSRFNVVQILPSLESGGVEKGTIDIANYLSELKISNFVISNGGRLLNNLDSKFTFHYNLPVHSKNFLIYPFLAGKIKKFIKNKNINIVHIRSRGPAWIINMIKKENFKTISTYHNVYGGDSYLKKIYNKRLSKVDQIVAISNYVKEQIIKKYDIDSKKICVINRGVDIDFFDNKIPEKDIKEFVERLKIDTNKKIILFPARLTRWKGQIEFLNVAKKLADQNILICFVGDTKNQSYTNLLKKKIFDNNLDHFCKIIGNLNSNDLKKMFFLSKLIVSFPLQPEGFGRTVSEALAMKKMILAFDYGGVKDQLDKLDSIYKTMPLNYDGLELKIKKILDLDIETMSNLTNNGKQHVSKFFSKRKMVSNYKELYERYSV